MAKENALIGTAYEDGVIYQANVLLEACKKMDITEGRLFYLGLMMLRPQLKKGDQLRELEPIKIPAADVVQLFGGNKKYYSYLKDVKTKLQGRTISLVDDDTEEKFHNINIFSEMKFDRRSGLRIEFSPKMAPYIMALAGRPYTKITGKVIFAMHSMYAIRLIEFMLEYQNINVFKESGRIVRSVSVEDLRAWLNATDKYAGNMSMFRKKVLDTPIAEINGATDYELSYTLAKNGRKITGFNFAMLLKSGHKEDDTEAVTLEEIAKDAQSAKYAKRQSETDGLDASATVDNLDASIVEVLRHYGVGKIVARRLANEFSEELIRNNIKYSLAQKRVINLGGYIAKAVRDDYYGTKQGAEKIRAAEEKARIAESQQSLWERIDPYKEDNELQAEPAAAVVEQNTGMSAVTKGKLRNLLNQLQKSKPVVIDAEIQETVQAEEEQIVKLEPEAVREKKENPDNDLRTRVIKAILAKSMQPELLMDATDAGLDVEAMCAKFKINLYDILAV